MSYTLWAILFGLLCGLVFAASGSYVARGWFGFAAFYALLGIFAISVIYEIGQESTKDIKRLERLSK